VQLNILNMSGSASRPNIETSTMSTSDAGATNAFSHTGIPGKLAARTLEIDFDFDPTQPASTGAASLFEVGDATETAVLTFSDAATTAWTANGYVTDYSFSAGLEERVQGSATIVLSGVPSAGW